MSYKDLYINKALLLSTITTNKNLQLKIHILHPKLGIKFNFLNSIKLNVYHLCTTCYSKLDCVYACPKLTSDTYINNT